MDVAAEKSNQPVETRCEVDRFTAGLVVLPFDDAAAAHAAEIRANLGVAVRPSAAKIR
jgi:tRNA(fMet)-specific endonuclease VapC